ncbi:YciI family protein [Methylocystis sp. WRRC1]|uniref:YciI family protein n=1 Tax=Methylocystis sp. WRRC1 TaxID=1732014 RepID=UPI001D14543D|nr:YciI family protein [Methylocystis sp. WRRC1]MCC3246806.1 YciI family protein [Methylocystis sp. WRRC1]
MLFAVLCYDKPDHLDLRMSTRAAHLAYLDRHAANVKLGGPFLEGEKPVGSMLILDCADEAAARALLAEDPYAQAGLFERVELRPWKRVVGAEL